MYIESIWVWGLKKSNDKIKQSLEKGGLMNLLV